MCCQIDHIKEAENLELLECARVIYMAGFFMTVSPETIDLVAKTACQRNKILCMVCSISLLVTMHASAAPVQNISAPFLVQVPAFKKTFSDVLPYVDFLFGNETEALAFAASEGWDETSIPDIALKISALPKNSGMRPRTVVITQGADATVVSHNGKIVLYGVHKIAKDKLVDTNGAGDAFVGGFLSQLVCGRSIEDCVRAGSYAASVIIQMPGCTFPSLPEFYWN